VAPAARRRTARARGVAAGLLTAALAAAAHGLAGGGLPTGSTATVLALLAATVGAVAATSRRAGELPLLLGLLGTGQLAAHLILAAAGHGHASPVVGGFGMLTAHVAAVAVGAALVCAADHLTAVLGRAVRAATRHGCPRPAPSGAGPVPAPEQPLLSTLLLATSLSRRGPPVTACP
jgi:hypothetical protein